MTDKPPTNIEMADYVRQVKDGLDRGEAKFKDFIDGQAKAESVAARIASGKMDPHEKIGRLQGVILAIKTAARYGSIDVVREIVSDAEDRGLVD